MVVLASVIMALVLLVLGCVTGCFARVVADRIAEPVNQLVDVVHALNKLDFSRQVSIVRTEAAYFVLCVQRPPFFLLAASKHGRRMHACLLAPYSIIIITTLSRRVRKSAASKVVHFGTLVRARPARPKVEALLYSCVSAVDKSNTLNRGERFGGSKCP